jgi:hypothetical protein
MAQTSEISHEEHHRALVRRFATEVKPTRRLWPVAARVGLWVILEVCVLAWAAAHTRNNFMHKLKQPAYLGEIIFFAGAAVISATLALRSAIPGRPLRAVEAMVVAVLVVAGTAFVTLAEPMNASNSLNQFVRVGLRCAYETWLYAAPQLLALWWMVRRGAPMNGRLSGLSIGAAALFFSFAIMRVACPIDEPLHLLAWHLLPALALIGLSTLAGDVWLRFRRFTRRPDLSA